MAAMPTLPLALDSKRAELRVAARLAQPQHTRERKRRQRLLGSGGRLPKPRRAATAAATTAATTATAAAAATPRCVITVTIAIAIAATAAVVVAVAPAVVRTAMVAAMPDVQVKYMTDKIPKKRTCELDEVVAVICFAASPACSFTTGFTFDATGGRSTY